MESKLAPQPSIGPWTQPARVVLAVVALCQRTPDSLIALLGRFSIAAVFWKSGQTKVQGLVVDIVSGDVQLGWPKLSDSAATLAAVLLWL